jgi:hypothetical protein
MVHRLLAGVEAGKWEEKPGASPERDSARGRVTAPKGRQTPREECLVVGYG